MLIKGLKSASGLYLKLFSEQGYDNFDMQQDIDIFIIFPECIGDSAELDDVEEKAQIVIEEFAKHNGPIYDLDTLKNLLLDALLDYDVHINIRKIISHKHT